MNVIITPEPETKDNPPSIKEIGEVLDKLKEVGLCKNILQTSCVIVFTEVLTNTKKT